MSATLPLVRQRGASSSSHGVGVSAGSFCVSAELILKVASYSIGAIQDRSWLSTPKKEYVFASQWSLDLCKLSGLVNVMCFQEINEHWAKSIDTELCWPCVWKDSKAIAWNKYDGGVEMVWHEWRNVFPNHDQHRKKHRGVLWAAHCLMGVNSLPGLACRQQLGATRRART